MNHFIKKILARKLLSAIIICAIIVGGYYIYGYYFGKKSDVRYVSSSVKRGTLIVSISGSGQTTALNQADIKSKVSGDIIYVGAKSGQDVFHGNIVAQIDSIEAQKSVRDAESSLDSAKLSFEKLKKPADALSILQAENSLSQAKEAKKKAEDDLVKSYDDGFNNVSNAFLDLPTVMTGLHEMLFSSDTGLGGGGQWNIDYYAGSVKTYDERVLQYKEDASNSYKKVRDAYDKNISDYKSLNRFSKIADIENLIDETYNTTKLMAESVKNANNLIQFYKDKLAEHNLKPQAFADTHLLSLNSYTGKTNAHLGNLLSILNNIKDSRDAILNSERTIAEKTESFAKLKAGADELDIKSQELTVKQRENALLDAKERLSDYYIRAPFDGVIAKINVKLGDSASNGSVLATIITKQRLVEISLNEVDIAKIKVGQKANIAFDAIDGLSIAGEVSEIDSIGTVTQGVVNYTVKIIFNNQDDRVKPGMSVSVSIITDIRQDALVIPNSAIKQQRDTSYVEIYVGDTEEPLRQNVQTGISNDTMTEIISGIKEGDKIVTQTVVSSLQHGTQTSQSAGLLIPNITGGGGGNFRTGGVGH